MDEPSDERIGHIVELGLNALKNAVLINAGACVALLALLGQDANKIPVAAFAFPIVFFAGGVVASAFGSGTACLAEAFSAFKWRSPAMWVGWVTFALFMLATALFCAGVCSTYHALRL